MAAGSLEAGWSAVATASSSFAEFFAVALSEGVAEEAALLDVMLAFGTLDLPTGPARAGDMECRGSARLVDGSWTVATGRGGYIDADGDSYRLTRPKGKVSVRWRPSVQTAIDPESPLGRFWGPALHRWRALQSAASWTSDVSELLGTALQASNLPREPAAMRAAVADRLVPSGTAPAGSIVFGPRDQIGFVCSPAAWLLPAPDARFVLQRPAPNRFRQAWTPTWPTDGAHR
ncbi:MAG: hypothetical protein ACLGI3_11900 [Actinomycetes bacterium]